MALRDAFERLLAGRHLSSDEAAAALADVVDGEVDAALVAGFLVALRMKGEHPDEIAGLARTMRECAVPVRPRATGLVDTCGTGGDGTGTANISTAAAFVVAGAGLPVAKHGNRALSSSSGSADVLEALGVPLDLDRASVERCIDEAGIGFIFAPAFHPAMAKVMGVRRALAVRTAFNLLGPLTNPARPDYQLVGVGHPDQAELVARALAALGVRKALVVAGAGGPDELTCAGTNLVVTVREGEVEHGVLEAADAGLSEASVGAIRGGGPAENADALRAVLEGRPGPVADCVLLNAGAAFLAAERVDSIREGVELARTVVAEGRAAAALERLVAVAAQR